MVRSWYGQIEYPFICSSFREWWSGRRLPPESEDSFRETSFPTTQRVEVQVNHRTKSVMGVTGTDLLVSRVRDVFPEAPPTGDVTPPLRRC